MNYHLRKHKLYFKKKEVISYSISAESGLNIIIYHYNNLRIDMGKLGIMGV